MVTLALQTRIPDAAIGADGWPAMDALMAVAQDRSGLSDFGPHDFEAGLKRLLQSLEQDAMLDAPSRAAVLNVLVRRLENRLRVEDYHRRHPTARDLPIAGPLCITGLPRTGTTALANMMSLDRQFRPLRPWEQAEPWYDEFVGNEAADPRRQATLDRMKAFIAENPDQMAMHLYEIDATEEDHDVIGLAFMAQHNTLPVGGYRSWWRSTDLRPGYAYHRRVMQVLESQGGGRPWLLKAPHYKFHMPDIADAYPDVRFVFTHRDPVKSLPSYISFVTNFYPTGTVDRIGLQAVAHEIYTHLLEGMRSAVEARDRLGEGRFVDMSQSALNRDPLGTLERLYGDLDMPFTSQFADDVRSWNAEHGGGAHGTHSYTAEQFGLSAEKIRADFAFYTDRFGDLAR